MLPTIKETILTIYSIFEVDLKKKLNVIQEKNRVAQL